MYVLIIVNGRTTWKGEITHAQTVTIGAAPTADIRLEGPGVAASHADLSFEGKSGWLCAHAPLTLDGQPVIGWAQLGELVQIGIGSFKLILHLFNSEAAASSRAPATPAGVAGPAATGAGAVAVGAVKKTGLTAIFAPVDFSEPPPPQKSGPAAEKAAQAEDARKKNPEAPVKVAHAKAKPPVSRGPVRSLAGLFKRKPRAARATPPQPALAAPPAAPPPNEAAPTAAAPLAASAAVASLGGLFALPAAEAARPARNASASAVLQRRRLGLTIKSWLMIVVSGSIGVVTFATREVPRATAGRDLGIQLVPSTAGRGAPERRPGKAADAPPKLVKAAADALIAGDMANALTLYRKLAESDAAFVPFVQALKRRLAANCNDPAARRDPC